MINLVDTKYKIGDTVYVRTDTDAIPCIVIAIVVYDGVVKYKISTGFSEVFEFFEFELTEDKPFL